MRRFAHRLVATALLSLPGLLSCAHSEGAEDAVGADGPYDATLVVFGKVRTMDPERPTAEAVVILGNAIERVCTEEEARARVGPKTRVVRAPKGAIVLPGLVESHAHLRGVGRAAFEIDLSTTRSIDEALLRVKEAADADLDRPWIVGRGWNQELWSDPRWPTARELDAVVGDRPAFLVRADGHAAWVNGAALARARIDASTAAPEGGEILKDASGAPLGILVDRAVDLIGPLAEGRFDPSRAERDYLEAQRIAFSFGITTFVDAGASRVELTTLLKLADSGLLKIRAYELASVDVAQDLVEVLSRPIVVDYEGRLTVRGVKVYADGALGSRGAALLEPYADRPEARGLDVTSPELVRKIAARCAERNFQLCVHAIGDRAVRTTLDAMEAAGEGAARRLRFRVEHAQHVDPLDVPRFAKLGVIASIQARHAPSDAPWAKARLGVERLERTGYRWRDLLDSGARLVNGTDAPVEPLSPFENFYAAATRRDPSGRSSDVLTEDQRLNRHEALAAATTWGAYAAFAEDRRGKLAPGYDADVCVVSEDLLLASNAAVRAARCLLTIVGGEVVHPPQGAATTP
jgi:predicted amidohydrolase YtcJ